MWLDFGTRISAYRTKCVHLFQDEPYGVLSDDCDVRLELMNLSIGFCKLCKEI